MKAGNEQTTQRSKRRRGRKAFWLGLLVLVLVVGGRRAWRQVQFTQLRVPLIRAVQDEDIRRVHDLLDRGADANVRMDYVPEPVTWSYLVRMVRGGILTDHFKDKTVLMYAAEHVDSEIVDLLLAHGADTQLKRPSPDPAQEHAMTALEYAAANGAVACVKSLLRHGAIAAEKGQNGRVALLYAIWWEGSKGFVVSGPRDESCVALLLQYGADVRTRGEDGYTPLMQAVGFRRYKDTARIIRLLTEHRAELEARDKEGKTALLHAALDGDIEGTRVLMLYGADPNPQDSHSKTALMYAVEGADQCRQHSIAPRAMKLMRDDYLSIIDHLLIKRADTSLRDEHGKTVLQIAEILHDKEVIALLKKAAARTSREGKTAGR